MTHPPLAALVLGLLVAAASAFATGAGPRPLPGVPLPPGGVPGTALPQFGPPPAWCWVEVRLFDSLRTGPIDFCRKNLRYRPGALECYRIVDNVCASLMNTGQWATGRTPVTRSVLPCPRGPQPPVCRQLDIE